MAKGKSEAALLDTLTELIRPVAEYEHSQQKLDRSSSRTKAEMMRKTLTPVQRALGEDPAKFMSILAPRRSGKSYGILVNTVAECVEFKGHRVAIICLTKPHAEGIYWADLLNLNEKYDLKIHFNNTKLSAKFPNGSLLVFAGAESKAEVAKVRGKKFHLVVIDESADYDARIYEMLIHRVVTPALQDLKGRLWIAGTPKGALMGEFYEGTCTPPQKISAENGINILSNHKYGEPEPVEQYKWSFHTWTAKENTAIPGLWDSFLEIKRWNGWKDDNPVWRSEYLGQWVTLDNAAVFNIRRHQHTYAGPWPWDDHRKDKCRFILGADFGYHDGTAVVIWCYLDDEPYLYEYVSLKKRGIVEAEIAALIKECEARLPTRVLFRVGDPGGGGVLIMEGLKRSYGLSFEVAEKHQKLDHIHYFNSSLDSNLVRFRQGSDLVEEMEAILWDEKTIGTSRQKEDARYPNDLADAALYAFRFAKSRFIDPPPPDVPTISESEREKAEYVARRDARIKPWWTARNKWD